ncbi:MAG TPA: hypothetical protein VMW89_06880, partial [Desulfatiglandales bacterium]|nr:hypothetical protein [Desulfatiglandales bacterium]
YQHFGLTRGQETNRAHQDRLTQELDTAHKELERANHQVALLEAYITACTEANRYGLEKTGMSESAIGCTRCPSDTS